MNDNDFAQRIKDEFESYKNSSSKPNILLVGGTGVGKSSLVNECFGQELATTGVGAPVTQEIDKYFSENVPVVLFDTKGYEIGSSGEQAFLAGVIDFAEKTKADGDPIHLAWYCIQASGGRITEFDVNAINNLNAKGTPTAVVLTKAELLSEEESKQFIAVIKQLIPDVAVFETSSKDKINQWQLAELCQWSIDQLPDALKVSFAAAQKKNLKIKRDEANKIILQHTGGSAFVGFSPIPMSDAPLLLANQAGMVARILYVYNLHSFLKSVGTAFISSIVGGLIARTGIWMVGSLIKFIPVVGTAIGGVINASVASAITWVIGVSVIELCEKIINDALEDNAISIADFISKYAPFFESSVDNNFNKKITG